MDLSQDDIEIKENSPKCPPTNTLDLTFPSPHYPRTNIILKHSDANNILFHRISKPPALNTRSGLKYICHPHR